MSDVREKLVELLVETTRQWGCQIGLYGAMADHLITNGVIIQRWIPVTERLPEKGDNYLCIVKSCLFRGATYQTILGYDKGGFHDGCIDMEDVTHWMPLPESPEEG